MAILETVLAFLIIPVSALVVIVIIERRSKRGRWPHEELRELLSKFTPAQLEPSVTWVTDDSEPCVASFLMEGRSEPYVTFTDRIEGGIVVGFEDGKTAFYSAALLYATLPQAQMMPSDSEDTYPPHGEAE